VVRSRTLGPRNRAGKPGVRRGEGPSLIVEHSGGEVRTALSCNGETLWSGPWEIEIRSGGRRVAPPARWDEVRWLSDDGVRCLELDGEFGAGFRVQRLFVLSWKERFALLADAIFAPSTAELDYCSRLPLGESIHFAAEKESWEGFLASRGRRALALPLGLPEWRTAPAAGALVETAPFRALELRRAARGRALWAPMFIDLDVRRFRRERTWRTLTVAENLRALPPDVAVGYRVAVGSRQWLIYRSLAAKANRSVLGHNLSSEMLVARFERKGHVELIMEIE